MIKQAYFRGLTKVAGGYSWYKPNTWHARRNPLSGIINPAVDVVHSITPGGGVIGTAKSNQHMQNAYKARKQNQLRASRYAMQALSKMRLKPNQLQAIRDKLNTALKTYGVQEQV